MNCENCKAKVDTLRLGRPLCEVCGCECGMTKNIGLCRVCTRKVARKQAALSAATIVSTAVLVLAVSARARWHGSRRR